MKLDRLGGARITPTLRRNILIAPLVLLIRIPIILPLVALYHAGQWAVTAIGFVGPFLPGFKRDPAA